MTAERGDAREKPAGKVALVAGRIVRITQDIALLRNGAGAPAWSG